MTKSYHDWSEPFLTIKQLLPQIEQAANLKDYTKAQELSTELRSAASSLGRVLIDAEIENMTKTVVGINNSGVIDESR